MKRLLIFLAILSGVALVWAAPPADKLPPLLGPPEALARITSVVLIGSPPTSGPQTITREGYEERALSDSETNFSWSVTIPSNTTAIVLVSASYGFYSGNPLVSAYLDLESDQNFTVDANIDGTNEAGVGIGHLFSPNATGAQSINVTVGAHGYDGYLYIVYYSGTATDGLRDSDAVQATSVGFTTVSGDKVVTCALDVDNTSITWTNATEFDEYAAPASYGIAIADMTADGVSETISTSGSSVVIAGIVLKPGS